MRSEPIYLVILGAMAVLLGYAILVRGRKMASNNARIVDNQRRLIEQQDEGLAIQIRQAEALERIATALEAGMPEQARKSDAKQ